MADKIIIIDGDEAVQYEGVTYVTDNESVGYFADGYPTDAQVAMQDELDNATQAYFDTLIDIANRCGFKRAEQEHDIEKLMNVLETAFAVLEIPDIY